MFSPVWPALRRLNRFVQEAVQGVCPVFASPGCARDEYDAANICPKYGTPVMPMIDIAPRKFFPRLALAGLACAVLVPIAACNNRQNRSEAPMNASPQAAAAGAPQRKLNSNPTKAYEIRMTLANAPGGFELINAAAQFDVQNPGECGNIDPVIGAIPRITSNEPITLKKVSDTEYTGIVYLDQIVDEDYFGRAVCHWALAEARVVLKATGDEANTRFIFGLPAEKVIAGGQEPRYFWSGSYPRAKMDAFRDLGDASLDKVPADKRDEFFSITLSAKEIAS